MILSAISGTGFCRISVTSSGIFCDETVMRRKTSPSGTSISTVDSGEIDSRCSRNPFIKDRETIITTEMKKLSVFNERNTITLCVILKSYSERFPSFLVKIGWRITIFDRHFLQKLFGKKVKKQLLLGAEVSFRF